MYKALFGFLFVLVLLLCSSFVACLPDILNDNDDYEDDKNYNSEDDDDDDDDDDDGDDDDDDGDDDDDDDDDDNDCEYEEEITWFYNVCGYSFYDEDDNLITLEEAIVLCDECTSQCMYDNYPSCDDAADCITNECFK